MGFLNRKDAKVEEVRESSVLHSTDMDAIERLIAQQEKANAKKNKFGRTPSPREQ